MTYAPSFLTRLALLAAVSLPAPLVADGLETAPLIDITHLVGEASDQDMNGDGLNDRLLLVINDVGDAVDMIVLMSDPQTGAFAPPQFVRTVLPTELPRHNYNLHQINYAGGSDPKVAVQPVITVFGPQSRMELVLKQAADGWQIDRLSGAMAVDAPECRLNYAAGRGVVIRVRQDSEYISIGAAPKLRPYWWQDGLAAVCLG